MYLKNDFSKMDKVKGDTENNETTDDFIVADDFTISKQLVDLFLVFSSIQT